MPCYMKDQPDGRMFICGDLGDHCAHVCAFNRHGERTKLSALRDEFVRIASDGRFVDSASREWRGIPMNWRMALVLMAGLGDEAESPAAPSEAAKRWHEIVREQDAARFDSAP